MDELRPSKAIWDFCNRGEVNRPLSGLGVCSTIADMLAGYHVSYTATEILKDLGLVDQKGNDWVPNKKALKILSHHRHEKFHRGRDGVVVTEPKEVSDATKT